MVHFAELELAAGSARSGAVAPGVYLVDSVCNSGHRNRRGAGPAEGRAIPACTRAGLPRLSRGILGGTLPRPHATGETGL